MKLNKKQKRTATIASMAALLAVVLGMGGQTFAKYITTTQTGTVQATVAKWGFVVTADATNMFSKSYATTETKDVDDDDNNKVSVKAKDAVVAPGTFGSMQITLNGSAEVDARVKFDVDGENDDVVWNDIGFTKGTETPYSPIKWSVSGTNSDFKDGTLADVAGALDAETTYYNAGDTAFNKTITISWNWAFDGNDTYDTLLGYFSNGVDFAYNGSSYSYDGDSKVWVETTETEDEDDKIEHYNVSTSLNFEFSITIEQVD